MIAPPNVEYLDRKGTSKMKRLIQHIANRLRSLLKVSGSVMRSRAVETIEYEIEELDNIFGVLVLGSFIGLPSPPVHITMELLPAMNNELNIMLEKMVTAHDPLGDLFSVLGID